MVALLQEVAWPHFAVDSLAGQRDGCVWRTDYGSGDEISAALPAGHFGRADRRMEGLLAGRLGQRPAVLLGDGDQGEDLKNPKPVLRSREPQSRSVRMRAEF